MNQLTALNVTLLLLGLFLQIAITVQGHLKKKQFSIVIWLKENWLDAIISITCSFAGLIMAEDIIELLGVKAPSEAPLFQVHAFISGYAGRELIFRVLGIFNVVKK
jgi:hypothetical protein